ncbi:hypothetical protein [Ramlibacter rhizophilus]|uniref:Pyridoxamine 5'-phosphate oxidase family protein n=1 Tax=Ramlibacter rhizophilus TaxID=1781167 RepID=A0A4Z0C434_9BURK|nr:hypothetical protein [Ramlibacter rhizophilus]TFZ04949.1 hypothetical protein EZ242_04155 [Ramlibacter rhizophilus]
MSAPGAAVLSVDQARMVQGPVSIMLGSCGPLRRPHVARGIGCCVSADRGTVSVLVQPSAAAQVVDDVRANGRLAVVFTEPISHRSLQLKGSNARLEPAGGGGRELAQIWAGGYAREVVDLAPPTWTPQRLIAALVPANPDDLAVLVFTPDAIFDQTPGPRAGEPAAHPAAHSAA